VAAFEVQFDQSHEVGSCVVFSIPYFKNKCLAQVRQILPVAEWKRHVEIEQRVLESRCFLWSYSWILNRIFGFDLDAPVRGESIPCGNSSHITQMKLNVQQVMLLVLRRFTWIFKNIPLLTLMLVEYIQQFNWKCHNFYISFGRHSLPLKTVLFRLELFQWKPLFLELVYGVQVELERELDALLFIFFFEHIFGLECTLGRHNYIVFVHALLHGDRQERSCIQCRVFQVVQVKVHFLEAHQFCFQEFTSI